MSEKVLLVGNPNCGKTSIFNALTGARQHVGNYPGVTVESKSGSFKLNDMQIDFGKEAFLRFHNIVGFLHKFLHEIALYGA